MTINEITGKNIKDARTRLGMSQSELAEKLHYSTQMVSNWENGKSRVREEAREQLSEILGIPIDYATYKKGKAMKIKPLDQINDYDELFDAINEIVGAVELDSAFESSIRRCLFMLLSEVAGYHCYYEATQR